MIHPRDNISRLNRTLRIMRKQNVLQMQLLDESFIGSSPVHHQQ
jgi:hypothetical protein